jgi:beta-glucuronidase
LYEARKEVNMLYPILTNSRFLSDLSGVWNFKLDQGQGFSEKWYEAPLQDAITMPVPASYNDLKEGIDFRDHYGWVFYQRTFALPGFIKNQRVIMRFEAVTHEAKVYLNGELLCEHKGGFLPFEVQLNEKLKDGDNLLTVAVSNIIDYTTLPVGGTQDMMGGMISTTSAEEDVPKKPKNNPNFDFFNYCGITRPIKIYTTPEQYIKDVAVVSEVNGADATLHYTIDTVGDCDDSCKIEVFDKNGTKVAEGIGTSGFVKLQNVTLWQPLKAYLYQIKVTYGKDEYTLPYGVRTVRVDGTKFLVNEKPFYFKGYGKHEDTFPNGRGVNMPMNVKDISLMKWQGANSFRTSHYPYSEEMMRLCDEEGIVVIDETTGVGINFMFGGGANFGGQRVSTYDLEHGIKTFAHHMDVVTDLIDRDKNYACVVMWSIANEADTTSEGAYEYFKPLFDRARELDPQKRPCTLISVHNDYTKDITAKLSDVICLNRYFGWYYGGPDLVGPEKLLRKELEFWSGMGKPVMFTEYGADTVMGFHDTTPVMYTEEYQVDYYKMNNNTFDDYPFVVGEQVWNFADFATSQSLLRVQGNKKGIFTRDRKPKLVAHYLKSRWTNIPNFDYEKKRG